jgi:hypothetical protein
MDSLPMINESLPDVGAVERANDILRQTGGGPKGTPQRRPKKGEPKPATVSRDRHESHAEEDGGQPLLTGSGEEAPVDRERQEAYYGRDRTIASIQPKGRLIDIAI